MPFLIFFLIWYGIWGQNNPRTYHKLAGKLPKIFAGLIFLSIFSSVIPELLGISIALLAVGGVFLGPFIFLGWLINKTTKGKKRQQKRDYEAYQRYYQATHNKGRKGTSSMTVTGLTKSVSKRVKIVEKFNKKYELNLTDAEIDRIVDASYYSNCWEREIYDMSQNYDAMTQWYNSDTGWLRAYLHSFPVQNVTSDFEAQHEICLETFKQVFDAVKPDTFTTIDDCVQAINRAFFTNFDESSFMIAYRFLERNGCKYKLPHMKLMKATSDLDVLRKKYDAQGLGELQQRYDNQSLQALQQKYDNSASVERERRGL